MLFFHDLVLNAKALAEWCNISDAISLMFLCALAHMFAETVSVMMHGLHGKMVSTLAR